jgi:hypothetical protein
MGALEGQQGPALAKEVVVKRPYRLEAAAPDGVQIAADEVEQFGRQRTHTLADQP